MGTLLDYRGDERVDLCEKLGLARRRAATTP